MINSEQKEIHREKISTKEKLLSNPAFIRFTGGFELYQKLLHSTDKTDEKDAIKQRIVDLYGGRLTGGDEEDQESGIKQELFQIINSALDDCCENRFAKDSFAEKLANSSVVSLFLSEWNRSKNEVEGALV